MRIWKIFSANLFLNVKLKEVFFYEMSNLIGSWDLCPFIFIGINARGF